MLMRCCKMPGFDETVQERLCASFSQYFGIAVGIVTVIALGLSVHHDVQWNGYVNDRFNLNSGLGMTKLNARDYIDVESQQEWIDIINRPHLLETIVIFLVVIATCLKGIHIIASPSAVSETRMPQDVQALNAGAFVFLLSAFLEGSSAILIITSIVAAQDSSNQIVELIHGPKTNWPDITNSTPLTAYEMDLYMNVYCNTHENKWVSPKQCQLTFAKMLATIFCLLNVVISFTVSFNIFCNNMNQVKPFQPPKRTTRLLASLRIKNQRETRHRKQRLSVEANQKDVESFKYQNSTTDKDALRNQNQFLTTEEDIFQIQANGDGDERDSDLN
ncbi:hypothetical protein Ocin01_04135 [Orchesella cincta]|uniref:Uncharacterized protein n=1 Tax=Orchesella cincta TaxID=48709 RepID=A0A1D2NBC8_ORCCI|nr:hypothetical protein Ocin01_04135 [Orchesella cincta]